MKKTIKKLEQNSNTGIREIMVEPIINSLPEKVNEAFCHIAELITIKSFNKIKKTFQTSMRTSLSVIFFCSLFNTSYSTIPDAVSPSKNNPTNGHSYILLESSTWTDAEAAAILLGGHLVTLNDASEESFIWDTFKNYEGTERPLWIGLNDVATDGLYEWTSGESVTYTNWASTEPNNCGTDENYVNIFPVSDSRAGYWNDNINSGLGGCGGLTVAYGVVEIPCPHPLVTPTVFTLYCVSSSAISVPLTANSSTTLSYQWQKSGVDISGATSQIYTATASGSYTVIETNIEGCSQTSTASTIFATLQPTAKITAPFGLDLCATGTVTLKANNGTGLSYKWYKNGIALTGAISTNRVYTAKKTAIFTVVVTTLSGCSKTSAGVTVTKTGCRLTSSEDKTLSDTDSELNIYPNPVKDLLNIFFETDASGAQIQIVNSIGQTVMEQKQNAAEGLTQKQVNVSDLPIGIYLLKISTSEGSASKRFIKQ